MAGGFIFIPYLSLNFLGGYTLQHRAVSQTPLKFINGILKIPVFLKNASSGTINPSPQGLTLHLLRWCKVWRARVVQEGIFPGNLQLY